MEIIRYVWAKTGENEQYHPLIHHLLDVGAMATEICRSNRMNPVIQSFLNSLSVQLDVDYRWLSFIAALHDIGKAYPRFQFHKHAPNECIEQLKLNGLKPDNTIWVPIPHNMVSQVVFKEVLEGIGVTLEKETELRLAIVLGGHHGIHSTKNYISQLKIEENNVPQWNDIRHEITKILFEVINPSLNHLPILQQKDNITPLLLTGLISTADWLASNQEWFPCNSETINYIDYWEHSLKKSKEVLQEIGWNGWDRPTSIISFPQLFENKSPRPLQDKCINVANDNPNARLVIIEAPMGEGKTEAALYLQDSWMINRQQAGAYFALPTMAASNQLFERTEIFLQNRYHTSTQLNLHLLHSHKMLNDHYASLRSNSVAQDGLQDEGNLTANEWFIKPKRGLLAPFAVGTIDQALMSVLQVRYSFLRLLGLANKTIIFDEVHAYDTYMFTLFERLLQWLSKCGTTVVILSATLPHSTRKKMLQAFGSSTEFEPQEKYPRITVYEDDKPAIEQHVDATNTKTIYLEKVDDNCNFRKELIVKLSKGGCGVWICNTVNYAQKLYEELKDECEKHDISLDIFHARFPLGQRVVIENNILKRYGKGNEHRPKKSLLIATQGVEQSLDLDFDWMITEMAPVDLLLQRSGRMHRHDRERFSHFAQPTLSIIQPDINEVGLPELKSVYSEYIIFRTWLVLQGRTIINIPDDMDNLIQKVYSDDMISENDCILDVEKALKKKFNKEVKIAERKAKTISLIKPTSNEFMRKLCVTLKEDNPELHPSLQATTREFQPSVTLVCLHDETLLNLPKLSQDLVQIIIHNSVTLSFKGCTSVFDNNSPDSWKKNGLLRNMKPVIFNHENEFYIGNVKLVKDTHVGIKTIWLQEGENHESIIQSDF